MVVTGDPLADLVGHQVVVVASGNERTGGPSQLLAQERHLGRLLGVQEVVLIHLKGVAAQLVPAGNRVNASAHAPVLKQHLAGLQNPRHTHT